MEDTLMRVLATALALTFVTGASAYAMDEALTEQQVECVQKAIKGIGCTVEDTGIEMQDGGGFKANDVMCEDGKYDIYLDNDCNVADKDKK
jgi:hypothetical protein